MFGLIAFLLNYIPNIGSVLAVVFPSAIMVLDPKLHIMLAVGAFFTLGSMQFLLGQIIEPRILGRVLDVPALTIIACLLFWGFLSLSLSLSLPFDEYFCVFVSVCMWILMDIYL